MLTNLRIFVNTREIKKKIFLFTFFTLGSLSLCLNLFVFPQENKKVDQVRLEFRKKSPLPKKNTRLKKKAKITDEGQITEELYLRSAYSLAVNTRDEIYVSDMENNCIYKFNLQGKLITHWGKTGQGPGDLSVPLSLGFYQGYLVVNDNGNRRLVFFTEDGDFVKSFKIYRGYNDLAISKEGLIYGTPFFVTGPGKKLVDVINMEGRRVNSFGKYPAGISRLREFWGRIAFNQKRQEVYLAYTHFLIVQRYSSNGELLGEYRIDHPGMKIKEEENRKKILSSSREGVFQVIDSIEPKDDGFYVLITYPRIEILEYDLKGELMNDYWYEFDDAPGAARDFKVIEKDGNKIFIIIFEPRYSPIYIFSVK